MITRNINFFTFIVFLNIIIFIKFANKAINYEIFSILEALIINIFSFTSSLIHNPLFVITAKYFPSDVNGDFNPNKNFLNLMKDYKIGLQ